MYEQTDGRNSYNRSVKNTDGTITVSHYDSEVNIYDEDRHQWTELDNSLKETD